MRRFSWIAFVLPLLVFLSIIAWHSGAVPAAAQSAQPARLAPVSKTSTSSSVAAAAPTVAPAGTEFYVAQRGDSIPAVAHRLLPQTSYLTSSELSDAIHQANSNLHGVFLRAGQQIIVPGVLPAPIAEKTIAVPRDFEVRAIYLTGLMAGSDHGLRIIRHWREVGGNAVVFDIKDSDGSVNIPFENPLIGSHHTPIRDLPKFVHFLHEQNMHAIARVAIFRDEKLVLAHPELAVKSRRTGQPWRENGKLVWTDPSQPKVQAYDIALAKRAAEAGVDEVQFDYVRFPAEGDQKDASFLFQKEHPDWQRSDVIVSFLKTAYGELHPTGVLLSLDVFGVMAWQRQVDLSHTGQDIPRMAKYCDVLSPMIYPSHFFGMDGIAHPGDAPEHFIGESMDRFEKITQGSGVVIRPWLQAFGWRTKTYSPQYIETQVLTAKNKGGIGFLFWNANNDYSKPYTAMPEMRAAKGKYFRGDELTGEVRAAAATQRAKIALLK
ncbi:MAG TPA: putative glycoside hydrolase [Terriglobales bacterium]|nr:putative glycoside hydrolase [Terriglobales bacterium]